MAMEPSVGHMLHVAATDWSQEDAAATQGACLGSGSCFTSSSMLKEPRPMEEAAAGRFVLTLQPVAHGDI